MPQYQFTHEGHKERARLAIMQQLEDPGTIRHLEAIGVGEGWRCLEVGAGAGSIARWLSGRVGPTGHVLATDLESDFLKGLDAPNLEVRHHDIASDPVPEGGFDLIHERLVLMHLPTREEVLRRLVRALKPGGWLLCEDVDFTTFIHAAPTAAMGRFFAAFVEHMKLHGADFHYGQQLFGALRAAGLEEVGAEGRVSMMQGAQPSSLIPRYTVERFRDAILAAGDVSDAEYDQILALYDDPNVAFFSHIMVAAWGRRPTG